MSTIIGYALRIFDYTLQVALGSYEIAHMKRTDDPLQLPCAGAVTHLGRLGDIICTFEKEIQI
jgi:hypothetical protein